MVSFSLVWVWRSVSERVSPLAVAFCRLWEPRRINKAARLAQPPKRRERRWPFDLRAVFNGTCDPASKDVFNASRNGPSAVANIAVRLGCPHRGKHEHSLN